MDPIDNVKSFNWYLYFVQINMKELSFQFVIVSAQEHVVIILFTSTVSS